jgi:hypothetical protein
VSSRVRSENKHDEIKAATKVQNAPLKHVDQFAAIPFTMKPEANAMPCNTTCLAMIATLHTAHS